MSWSLLAHTYKNSPTGGTTPSIDTTGADLIVVVIGSWSGGVLPSLTDSASNTWTEIAWIPGTSTNNVSMFYCANPTTSATHTFTSGDANHLGGPNVMAFSGADAIPFDTYNGQRVASSSAPTTGAITPAGNGYLVVMGDCGDGSGWISSISLSDSGTPNIVDNVHGASSYNVGSAYEIQATAASVNATFNLNASSNCSLMLASFKPAGGGTTGTSATTNANDTSTASGTTTVLGTSATTDANDSSTASGTTTVLGTSATTNANDTATASGSAGLSTITGASATTNADDTSTAAGTTTVVGTSTASNLDDTSTTAGTTTVLGTSTAANADDYSTASGVVGTISGTVVYTNNNDTANASGSGGQAKHGGDDAPEERHEKSSRHRLKKLKKQDESLLVYLENVYETLNEAPPKFRKEVRQIVKPVKTQTGYRVDFNKLAENITKIEKLADLHEEYLRVQEEEDAIMIMLMH